MSLETRYELKIPSDAVVRLDSDGILGGTSPEIDITKAHGPALGEGGILRSEESNAPLSGDLIECLAAISNHQGCKLNKSSNSALQHK
jgi:uncharacterized membrane protein